VFQVQVSQIFNLMHQPQARTCTYKYINLDVGQLNGSTCFSLSLCLSLTIKLVFDYETTNLSLLAQEESTTKKAMLSGRFVYLLTTFKGHFLEQCFSSFLLNGAKSGLTTLLETQVN